MKEAREVLMNQKTYKKTKIDKFKKQKQMSSVWDHFNKRIKTVKNIQFVMHV